ncbi:MAG: siphovirus Gp157 family protein [Eubacterium sp.]|nr:siphovirus Gp157 family protein [Eubacterium sp.]
MTLYELTDQMYALLLKLEEIPPEDPEERETWEAAIRDTMEMLADDFAEKAEGYGQVMKQLQADAEAVKAEKMRLARRQQALENNIERMREAIKRAMLITDQKRVKTDLFSFSVSPRLDLVIDADVEEIPDDLVRVKAEPDKAAIKAFLKENPDGCTFAHFEPAYTLTVR